MQSEGEMGRQHILESVSKIDTAQACGSSTAKDDEQMGQEQSFYGLDFVVRLHRREQAREQYDVKGLCTDEETRAGADMGDMAGGNGR
jgi:hypothetical protein